MHGHRTPVSGCGSSVSCASPEAAIMLVIIQFITSTVKDLIGASSAAEKRCQGVARGEPLRPGRLATGAPHQSEGDGTAGTAGLGGG